MVIDHGAQLHDRRSRGLPLTAEEQELLQAWYEAEDRAELAVLQHEMAISPLDGLRSRLFERLTEMSDVTHRIRETATRNEQLRASNRALEAQLELRLSQRR